MARQVAQQQRLQSGCAVGEQDEGCQEEEAVARREESRNEKSCNARNDKRCMNEITAKERRDMTQTCMLAAFTSEMTMPTTNRWYVFKEKQHSCCPACLEKHENNATFTGCCRQLPRRDPNETETSKQCRSMRRCNGLCLTR